jgi:MerR family mercuric resistance operon transcriptional regulator
MSDTALSRGQLSARTGTNIETIRYYEKIGLIPPPPRTSGGHRVYGHDHLKRMRFIRRGRELGFTIADIRDLFGLVDSGDITCSEVKQMALRHAADLRGKIDDLIQLEATLVEMAAQCSGEDVPDCAIVDVLYNSGSVAAAANSGASSAPSD